MADFPAVPEQHWYKMAVPLLQCRIVVHIDHFQSEGIAGSQRLKCRDHVMTEAAVFTAKHRQHDCTHPVIAF